MHRIIAIGALLGMLAVAFGAMGAHALKPFLTPKLLTNFHTAADYQMYHALAIVLAGLAYEKAQRPSLLLKASWLFISGIVLFSGSLYIYSLSGVKAWAMITPIGGLAFILGWIVFALAFLLSKK